MSQKSNPMGVTLLAALLILWSAVAVDAGFRCYKYVYSYNLVKAAQTQLTIQGFNPGPIDGAWGRKTKFAVWRFQEHHGLKETEELDEATLQALFGDAYEPGSVTIIQNPDNVPREMFEKYCK